MKILALDLGTKTGWACSFDGGSGVWNLTPGRHESSGMRWLKFQQSLYIVQNTIELVVYEEIARHLGTHAAHIYGGLVAILQQWCLDNKIDYQGIPVGTIKKFATGKGNASKDMMIKAAKEFVEKGTPGDVVKQVEDDNEADAICLLAYAEKQFGAQPGNKEE